MLNHIVIQGRLVRDPELRKTQSGVSVCSVSIACDRDFADKATGERECDFIDIVAWRGTADFLAKHFNKGRMVVVSGRLQMRKWTDNNGNNRTAAEVLADNIYFSDSKKDGNTAPAAQTAPAAPSSAPASDFAMLEDDSELPF